MPINQCTHSWQHLTNVVVPALMEQMREAMQEPTPMNLFATHKPKEIERALLRKGDFSGCYVLLDEGKPVYVGISRGVLERLRQHVTGKTPNDASLTYQFASEAYPHSMQRKKALADPGFQKAFDTARDRIRLFQAAFIEIDCPVELYAFELYCAMELDTAEWNTFRTH